MMYASNSTSLRMPSIMMVNNDLPVGIFWFSQNRDGYNIRVRDWHPNSYGSPDLTWSLPYVWIEEE